MGLFLLLAIMVGIFITVYAYYNITDIVIYVAFIIGETGLLCTFIIFIGNVCRRYRKFMSFDGIVYLDLNEYLKSINVSPFYIRRGLFWRLQQRRFWLELDIGPQNA